MYMWVEIYIFLAQTLIKGVEEEYLSYALNFRTFRNMNKKLWLNMYFISQLGQSPGAVWAHLKFFFFRKKIWDWFSKFMYMKKGLNHSILIYESKVIRCFSLRQLWNLYFEINFEVHYFTHFSIFLEKK